MFRHPDYSREGVAQHRSRPSQNKENPVKLRLIVMLCAGALSASAFAQNPAERQRNRDVPIKDGTSVSLPAPAGCALAIPDDAYNGTQASMVCLTVPGPNVAGGSIIDANVAISAAHTWAGDLTMKVYPPGGGNAVTLVSRPGFAELADDGAGCCGSSADLLQANVLSFDDEGGFPSAETMGTGVTTVPASSFTPNAGAATPGTLSAFAGLPANGGDFLVCVGDSVAADTGFLCDAQIDFTTGVAGDLSITKNAPSGVTTSGVFPFDLAVANAGPADHPGATVTDTLPAGLAFVGSSCGATAAGQTITWNVGALASGGSASCQLFVRQTAAGCASISNTATIVGTDGSIVDPPGNNSSTYTNGAPPTQLLGDPGFETGSPNASWAEASSNFGSPLCTIALCGAGGGTGPQSGTWWSWFGGIGGAVEIGSVQQSVVIPAGGANITFGFEAPVCVTANGANDFVRLLVGGTEVWRRDATAANCNTVGYVNQSVDVSAFATGAAQMVRFESTQSGVGGPTNFFIDNVSLNSVPTPVCTAPIPADLSITLTDAPDPITAGGATPITYTMSITNNGTTYAENMQAALALPAGVTLTGATASNGGTCAASTCTWAGFTAPGVTYTATVTASVPANAANGSILTATATASSPTPDNNAANNTATTTTTVATLADLVVTLVSSTAQTDVNVPVTFSATSTNGGPSDAQNVVLAITLSPDFRYTSHSASAGATCSTPQVGNSGVISCTWAGATIPGGVRTLSVDAFSNNTNQNTVGATTSSATADPNLNNNAATVSVTVGLVVEEIPTVGRNAMLLMALLLALGGFVAVRRNS
jgi:uncharacterized repeat protein (TIGR01451 family)